MPRKSTKNPEVSMNAIEEVISIPANLQFCEISEQLGIGEAELRERLESKLNNSDVHFWDTIPAEHQSVVDVVARDLETEKSVRRFDVPEPAAELPPVVQEELPIIQDEAPSPKRTKKASTALTKAKSEAIQGNKSKTQKLATTADTLQMQNAVKRGQIKGTKKAILELQAEQATYDAIVAASLKRESAVLASEIASFAGFDPNQLLQEAGITTPQETYTDLQETIEPQLELLSDSVSEITAMDWLQDVDFFGEMGNLNKLLTSKISEIGC